LFEHDLFGKPVPTFPDHALDAPYRAAKYLQIGNTPLRGINNSGGQLMSSLQAALRTSALVMAVAFPHHRAQERTATALETNGMRTN
jgi:hypothetical protein